MSFVLSVSLPLPVCLPSAKDPLILLFILFRFQSRVPALFLHVSNTIILVIGLSSYGVNALSFWNVLVPLSPTKPIYLKRRCFTALSNI